MTQDKALVGVNRISTTTWTGSMKAELRRAEHTELIHKAELIFEAAKHAAERAFLCGLTSDPRAVKAYTAVLYVQSSLLLDAEEMRLAEKPRHWPRPLEAGDTLEDQERRRAAR